MLLSDDEEWKLWNTQGIDDMNQAEAIAFARAYAAAILAKLASAELPPLPAYECGPHTGHAAVRTDESIRAYGLQAHAQGFAAGAAAQLSAEPTALMWQHDETGRVGFIEAWWPVDMFKESNPRLRIVASLYTRRES